MSSGFLREPQITGFPSRVLDDSGARDSRLPTHEVQLTGSGCFLSLLRVPVGRSDMVAAMEVVITQAGLAVAEPSKR